MTTSENGPKEAMTIRVKPDNRVRLIEHARLTNRNLSSLADQAIEELLSRTSNDWNPPSTVTGANFHLDASDIEGMLEVLKAIGVPVSLKMFIEIIERRRPIKK